MKREKPGRKELPKEQKKIPVTVYVIQSLVTKKGGIEKVRKQFLDYIHS